MKDDYQMLVLQHLRFEQGTMILEDLPESYSYQKKHKIRQLYSTMGLKLINHLIKQYRPELLI